MARVPFLCASAALEGYRPGVWSAVRKRRLFFISVVSPRKSGESGYLKTRQRGKRLSRGKTHLVLAGRAIYHILSGGFAPVGRKVPKPGPRGPEGEERAPVQSL